MKNLLYLVAVVLVMFWVLGFFTLHAPAPIHFLLLVAIISVLLGLVTRGRRV